MSNKHIPASFPHDEETRLESLCSLDLLDTPTEQVFDSLVELAQTICDVPIALVSLVDRERQWFKAKIGLEVRETHRDMAFCAHAILTPDSLTIVEDTHLDARFVNSPLVVGPPHIRFYAGAPIISPEGLPLGTVCVIDRRVKTLNAAQQAALLAIAHQASMLISLRSSSVTNTAELVRLSNRVKAAFAGADGDSAVVRRNQRMTSIGQLTSGVAHDFNNLLQTLSVNFQILERRSHFPVDVENWAKKGLEAVRRGAGLVTHLLAMSRNEPAETKQVSIYEQLHRSEDMFRHVLRRAISLQWDLERSAMVLCDPVQLESAVLNLVINARDALDGQGLIIVRTFVREIRCDAELSDGRYVVLQVEDDGCGMTPAVAQKVFEPFFSTKEDKGTGLGLAQVLGFALGSGGTARIESAVGKGTTVSLFLKAISEDRSASSAVISDIVQTTTPKQRTKILIIDDDNEARNSLATLLDASGHLVVPVASGYAAVPIMENYVPNIVISNLNLPGLGGLALAKVLRGVIPGLPLIFLTGNTADTQSLNLPADVIFLQKPVENGALAAAINRSLT